MELGQNNTAYSSCVLIFLIKKNLSYMICMESKIQVNTGDKDSYFIIEGQIKLMMNRGSIKTHHSCSVMFFIPLSGCVKIILFTSLKEINIIIVLQAVCVVRLEYL